MNDSLFHFLFGWNLFGKTLIKTKELSRESAERTKKRKNRFRGHVRKNRLQPDFFPVGIHFLTATVFPVWERMTRVPSKLRAEGVAVVFFPCV